VSSLAQPDKAEKPVAADERGDQRKARPDVSLALTQVTAVAQRIDAVR